MNPRDIERRAIALGYNDLVASAIPSGHSAVAPTAIAAAANGAIVEVKKKRVRKPKTVVGVPIAEVAPAGDVVLASLASSPSDSLRTVIPSSEHFHSFLEHYAKGKAHSKKETLYEYLQKQHELGKRWNPETRRFVGEPKPRKPRKKKSEEADE
jgi:hypothetical protein